MSNRLSFSQILQKKHSTGDSQAHSRVVPNISHVSHISRQPQKAFPSLLEMMEEYINYPNEDFTLSFCEDQFQDEEEYLEASQFESGVNPLDSWVMNQTKMLSHNAPVKKGLIAKNKISPELQKFVKNPKFGEQQIPQNMKFSAKNAQAKGKSPSINELARLMMKGKENDSKWNNDPSEESHDEELLLGNQSESMKSSVNSEEFSYHDSKRYGPSQPFAYANKRVKNKEMFGNQKFIQSQVYHNEDSKKGEKKMERSQGTGKQKISLIKGAERYKYAKQDTERSEVSDQKPSFKMISSKISEKEQTLAPQKSEQSYPEEEKKFEKKKFTPAIAAKLQSKSTEKNIITKEEGKKQIGQKYQYQNDKRIEDARKQIIEFLGSKTKNMENKTQKSASNQESMTGETKKIKIKINQSKNSEKQKTKEEDFDINYSFSNCLAENMNENIQSFSHNSNSQMEESPKNYLYLNRMDQEKQKEKMLACIKYASSEVDPSETSNQKSIVENEDSMEKFPNSQSFKMKANKVSMSDVSSSECKKQLSEDYEVEESFKGEKKHELLKLQKINHKIEPLTLNNPFKKENAEQQKNEELGIVSNIQSDNENQLSFGYEFVPKLSSNYNRMEKKLEIKEYESKVQDMSVLEVRNSEENDKANNVQEAQKSQENPVDAKAGIEVINKSDELVIEDSAINSQSNSVEVMKKEDVCSAQIQDEASNIEMKIHESVFPQINQSQQKPYKIESEEKSIEAKEEQNISEKQIQIQDHEEDEQIELKQSLKASSQNQNAPFTSNRLQKSIEKKEKSCEEIVEEKAIEGLRIPKSEESISVKISGDQRPEDKQPEVQLNPKDYEQSSNQLFELPSSEKQIGKEKQSETIEKILEGQREGQKMEMIKEVRSEKQCEKEEEAQKSFESEQKIMLPQEIEEIIRKPYQPEEELPTKKEEENEEERTQKEAEKAEEEGVHKQQMKTEIVGTSVRREQLQIQTTISQPKIKKSVQFSDELVKNLSSSKKQSPEQVSELKPIIKTEVFVPKMNAVNESLSRKSMKDDSFEFDLDF